MLPHCVREMVKAVLRRMREHKANTVKARLAHLEKLFIFNHPVDRVPQATGKLRLLQEGNTALLALFAKKCKEQGLRYWLDYGTLLGAVRHKGFIPWDDDLDVSMPRPDFEELLKNLPRLFPASEGFTWQLHAFLQISYKDAPLNIDVYPYHFYSEPLTAEVKERVETAATNFKKSVVFIAPQINYTDDQIQQMIAQKMLRGESPLPESEKPAIFLSPAITFTKNTVLAYDDIFPLSTETFEGIEFSTPNHSRQYLQFFYGDYMTYPSSLDFKHPNIGRQVCEQAYESAVNRFIDTYRS